MEYEVIEEICKRWGYRPHEVLEMPVWVLRMADVLALAPQPQEENRGY